MLQHLSIRNYALIQSLEIDFHDGLTVITGETGAGKSILMGALDLILGKRADTRVLLDKNSKCIVEGTFYIQNYGLEKIFEASDLDFEFHTSIRREINSLGKSRAFINDTPVNLSVLKDISERLIDIHSQHQNLAIAESEFQIAIIDSFANINTRVKNYKKEYLDFIEQKNILFELREQESKAKAEKDYFEFLFNELNSVGLKEGELEEIESETRILEHAEEIKSILFQSKLLLENEEQGILPGLRTLNANISKIEELNIDLKKLAVRINSSLIELSDILGEVEQTEELVKVDPQRLMDLNDRLNLIYGLQRKHGASSEVELLNTLNTINNKLLSISSLESKINKSEEKLHEVESALETNALSISQKRMAVFDQFELEIKLILKDLGMEDAAFKISHQLKDSPGNDGIDKVSFLFSANKGSIPMDISTVASGGEKSRLMLAIKSLISRRNLLPTIIFDEIDTGVSGTVADKVGTILLELSGSMQVIAITHLPQIAGKGKDHFLVFKNASGNSTVTQIKKLNPDERIFEIAKLLSGREVTDASVESAKHLLKN